MVARTWRKGNPCELLVELPIVSAAIKRSVDVPQKIKNVTTIWPSKPTSVYLSEEIQNINLKRYVHPYIYCSIIYNSQVMEAAQVSVSRWVDATAMIYLHNGRLPGCRKEGNLSLCDNTDEPGEHYAKWIRQSEKDKYHNDFTYMCNRMNTLH